jgi:hypothetical protein
MRIEHPYRAPPLDFLPDQGPFRRSWADAHLDAHPSDTRWKRADRVELGSEILKLKSPGSISRTPKGGTLNLLVLGSTPSGLTIPRHSSRHGSPARVSQAPSRRALG